MVTGKNNEAMKMNELMKWTAKRTGSKDDGHDMISYYILLSRSQLPYN